MYASITSLKIEWDEDGAYLIIDGNLANGFACETRARLEDPEQAYDAVKGGIGPWLRERDEAQRSFVCAPADVDESGGYDVSDPKHENFHSIHADLYDNRDGK